MPVRLAVAAPRLSVALLRPRAIASVSVPLSIDMSARLTDAPETVSGPRLNELDELASFGSVGVIVNVETPPAPCCVPPPLGRMIDHVPGLNVTVAVPATSCVGSAIAYR